MKRILIHILVCLPLGLLGQETAQEAISKDPLEAYRQYYFLATDNIDSKPEAALAASFQALTYAIETSMMDKVGNAHFLIAKVFFKIGDFPKSYYHYKKAIQFYKKTKNTYQQGMAYWGIALIYSIGSKQEELALFNYFKSKELVEEKIEGEVLAKHEIDLGNLYLNGGDYSKAIKVLSSVNEDSQVIDKAYKSYWLGQAYHSLGKQDSSNHFLNTAYIYAANTGDSYIQMLIASRIGLNRLEDNQSMEALSFFREAKEKAALIPYRQDLLSFAVLNIATNYFSLGQANDAIIEIRTFLNQRPDPIECGPSLLKIYDLYLREYVIPEKPEQYPNVMAERNKVEYALIHDQHNNPENIATQLELIDERLAREAIEEEIASIREYEFHRAIVVFVVALIIISVMIIRHKKQMKKAQDYVAEADARTANQKARLDEYQAQLEEDIRTFVIGPPDKG